MKISQRWLTRSLLDPWNAGAKTRESWFGGFLWFSGRHGHEGRWRTRSTARPEPSRWILVLAGWALFSSPTNTAQAQNDELQVVYLDYPQLQRDALGNIKDSEISLSDQVSGAKQLKLTSSATEADLRPLSFQPDATNRTVKFSCQNDKKKNVDVASLALKPEGLFWTWNRFSTKGLAKDSLKHLENALRRSMIVLKADGFTVKKFQFAPEELQMSLGGRRILKSQRLEMRLENGTVDRLWEAGATGKNKLRFTFEDMAFEVKLNTEKHKIYVTKLINLNASEVKFIVNKISNIEKKIKRLKSSRVEKGKEESLLETLSSLNEEFRTLKATKKRMIIETRQEFKRAASKVHKCSARIVLRNDVVLYRIVFKP